MLRFSSSLSVKKRLYGNGVVRVTNANTYLGMMFTTKLSLIAVLSEGCREGKKGLMKIQKSMRKLSSIDPCLFWKLFDAQTETILT